MLKMEVFDNSFIAIRFEYNKFADISMELQIFKNSRNQWGQKLVYFSDVARLFIIF